MPKIDMNGVIREMTAEEIAGLKRAQANIPERTQRTAEETRMDEIEAALIELAAMLGGA